LKVRDIFYELLEEINEKVDIIMKDIKQIKEKDALITKLQTRPTQKTIPSSPMADLIEDLQNRIKKLKLTIEEKNKIIEELKSS